MVEYGCPLTFYGVRFIYRSTVTIMLWWRRWGSIIKISGRNLSETDYLRYILAITFASFQSVSVRIGWDMQATYGQKNWCKGMTVILTKTCHSYLHPLQISWSGSALMCGCGHHQRRLQRAWVRQEVAAQKFEDLLEVPNLTKADILNRMSDHKLYIRSIIS